MGSQGFCPAQSSKPRAPGAWQAPVGKGHTDASGILSIEGDAVSASRRSRDRSASLQIWMRLYPVPKMS